MLLWQGICPGPRWESLQCSPDLQAGLEGLLRGERKGMGGRKEEGKGRKKRICKQGREITFPK